jgi:hypothetical protein
MAIDPTIKGAWIGHDVTLEGRDNTLMAVYIEREHAPFISRRTKP